MNAEQMPLPLDEKTVRGISKRNEEPDWLLERRLSALKSFQKLPLETSEIFRKYVDVQGAEWESFSFEEAQFKTLPSIFRFLEKQEANLVQHNGRTLRLQLNGAAEQGVLLLDWKTALEKHEKLLESRMAGKSGEEPNKFVSLNEACFDSGYVLQVPDNVHVEQPIRIVNLFSEAGKTHAQQNGVFVGKNSQVSVVEEAYSVAEKQALYSNVTRVVVGEGGKAHHATLQSLDEHTVVLSNKLGRLGKDAKGNWTAGHFGGLLNISRTDTFLQGEGAQAQDVEVAFGAGRQRFNVTSNLFHRAENTQGKVSSKSVFKDKAKGVFKGIIDISEQAKNTLAYLAGHAVLLSPDASADAIPALKIENNEVKATHSASVAQLNEDQIFYLMSRGFSEPQAKTLMVQGFLNPLLRQIPLASVQATVRGLVELKLQGQPVEKLEEAIVAAQKEEMAPQETLFERHYKYR